MTYIWLDMKTHASEHSPAKYTVLFGLKMTEKVKCM